MKIRILIIALMPFALCSCPSVTLGYSGQADGHNIEARYNTQTGIAVTAQK